MASVVDLDEAATALRGRVDVLDVKNPREGSLGASPPAVLQAAVRLRDRIAGGRPRIAVSAALGDAANLPGTFALAAAGAAACGVDYVKVGLFGLRGEEESVAFVSAVVDGARGAAPAVRVVAAAYADYAETGSIDPALLPRVVERSRAHGCLIDTARKDDRTLFDHLDAATLSGFIAECRRRGLVCALAGSLRLAQAARLRELGPDLVGVRGSICDAGRNGRLDPRRLRAFGEALRGAADGRRPTRG
jgi:(5-formylfuran-3-yl)methyl phosphate synthase